MTRTLFDIGADLLRVHAAIDDPTEAFDGTSALLNDWFASLQEEEGRKLDNCIGLIRTLEMEEVAARAEAEQWRAKADSRKARIEWLKARLLAHLVVTGRERVTTASGRVIASQVNGGKEPLTMAAPEEQLIAMGLVDTEYLVNVPRIDKELVRRRLEAGEALTFASLGERGRHLRLR